MSSAPMRPGTDAPRPAPRVGVVGAGQLARMLAEAASPLAIRLHLLAERRDDSAAQVVPDVSLGSPDSLEALSAFVNANDVTTFDHELVNANALALIEERGGRIHPSARVVALVQDKLAQRTALAAHEFPVPPFQALATAADLTAFAGQHGWPVVVKATRGGYDGRGVWVLPDEAAARAFLAEWDPAARPLLVEAYVPIERELAILVARRPSGDCAVFPVVETLQVDGICRELVAPARTSDRVRDHARALAGDVAAAIGVVGVLAIELFERDGRLIVNELAARPHNSGHYSIEGCVTSQFEQHLRAVLDWPLGDPSLVAPAVATVNVIGGARVVEPTARLAAALAVAGARVHLYGKEARPGRKLGHVTALATEPEQALAIARSAAARLTCEAEGEDGDG